MQFLQLYVFRVAMDLLKKFTAYNCYYIRFCVTKTDCFPTRNRLSKIRTGSDYFSVYYTLSLWSSWYYMNILYVLSTFIQWTPVTSYYYNLRGCSLGVIFFFRLVETKYLNVLSTGSNRREYIAKGTFFRTKIETKKRVRYRRRIIRNGERID